LQARRLAPHHFGSQAFQVTGRTAFAQSGQRPAVECATQHLYGATPVLPCPIHAGTWLGSEPDQPDGAAVIPEIHIVLSDLVVDHVLAMQRHQLPDECLEHGFRGHYALRQVQGAEFSEIGGKRPVALDPYRQPCTVLTQRHNPGHARLLHLAHPAGRGIFIPPQTHGVVERKHRDTGAVARDAFMDKLGSPAYGGHLMCCVVHLSTQHIRKPSPCVTRRIVTSRQNGTAPAFAHEVPTCGRVIGRIRAQQTDILDVARRQADH